VVAKRDREFRRPARKRSNQANRRASPAIRT
jgi:hypothetical protein